MATTQQPSVLEEETLVDTDVHISIPKDVLASYADEPYRSYLRAPGVQLKSPGWDPSMGGKIESRSLVTPTDVQDDVCTELHVDHPILNVFVNLARFSNHDTAVNLQSACNDFLMEEFLDDNDFHGLLTLAPQHPDKAAEEIDRLGDEPGIVGIFLPTTGPVPPLGDPKYDVIYETAEEHGLPPVYHGATNSGFDVGFPRYNQAFQQFVTAHVNAHLWSQTMTVTSLLVHGTPVKFPDLDFVILEAGIGWVPYLMFRLNKEIAMRRSEAPLLEKQPEEYIRESFYFASQPLGEPIDPAHMQSLLDIVGADSLLFASDYPHWDFDHPSELNAHLTDRFDQDERKKILHENAMNVFNLRT